MRLSTRTRPSVHHFWFKASVGGGLALALVLLAQSIANYHYISRRLVQQSAIQEAERKVVTLEKAIRNANARDAAQLASVIEQLRTESIEQVAWIRVTTFTGDIIAASGNATGAPFAAELLSRLVEERQPIHETRKTKTKEVFVSVYPVRLGFAFSRMPAETNPPANLVFAQPPSQPTGLPPGPRMAEIALYLDAVSAPFGTLRRNVLLGCSAAAALVAAMIGLMVYFNRYLRGKQLEQQLELARCVQNDLLPRLQPLGRDLDLAADCVPTWQVGGDFYDAFRTEGNCLALALGDVSGKGMSAALLMALLHGAIRSNLSIAHAPDLEQSSRLLNELLQAKSSPEWFATLFWCSYESETGVLRYVNAGHPPPVLVRSDGREVEMLRLTRGGPVLGLLREVTYLQADILIQPGDLLVIFSDGIIECMNAQEEQFGEERLLQVIREDCDRSATDLRDAILTAVRSFLGGESAHDDQTLLIARFLSVASELSSPETYGVGIPIEALMQTEKSFVV